MTTKTEKIKYKSLSALFGLLLASNLLTGCAASGVNRVEASDVNAELGIRYLQNGRLQLANEKLTKSITQNPNSAKSNHYFALLQQKLGDNNKAEVYFTKAIRLDSKNPELRNNYGSFLCKNKQTNKAINQFLIAVKDPLYRTPAYAYTNAGICLKEVGNNTRAEKFLRLALKKSPTFPSALLEMASVYNDRGIYPKAQAFMLRYENVGQSTPKALKLCAEINTRMNNTSKASSCRSALFRLFPSSEEALQITQSL